MKMLPKEEEKPLNSKNQACMLKLIEDVKFSLYETLTSLEEVWDDIGIKEEEKEVRLETVSSHIRELLTEMLNEECELKAKLELRVVEYSKELKQLYHDLHLPPKPNPPELSLVALENQLRNDVDTLNKEKHDRLKWLRRLRAEEGSMCEELVMTQHVIDFVGTPSLEQLRELEQNVCYLKSEKSKRSKMFETGRKEIISLWSKLEIDPSDEFEKNIQNDTMAVLSTDNLKKLEELKSKLENDHAELMLQLLEKRDQYKILLDRLSQQLNVLEKDGLQEIPEENTISTLKIFNLNISYLQKLKSKHLESFIQAIRTELEELWNKCYFGEDQRRNFNAFYAVEFTEEILADHEHQLNTMKFYYEDNKELFKLVSKREALWEKKLSIENNSEGNAKFNNRGGALMKALKEKQFVDKQLPKVSSQLKTKIEKWEEENETIFLFNGYKYIDHMESQKQNYEAGLQMKKDEKQQAKLKEMSPCGNKSMRKFLPKSANGRSPLKRGQSNLSHVDTANATSSIFRSPLTKKKKTQITTNIGSTKSTRTTPLNVANISKYNHTHSSLQNTENVNPKPRKLQPVGSKLSTQARKKSLKRRSIKAKRVLKEKNSYHVQEASVLKEKLEPNVSILSYDEFSHKVANVQFSSSFLEGPKTTVI